MKNFIDLFSGLKRAHGCTYVEKKSSDGTKIKGKSFVKREPVTDKLWQDHLNGIEPSLGIIPIDENNKCRWGCIDVDKYNLNHKKLINNRVTFNKRLSFDFSAIGTFLFDIGTPMCSF